jgi:ATP-dependent Clp protease ATP-binding subunit ClpA
VGFSQQLQAVLHWCIVSAQSAGNPTLTIDHLILATLDSPGVAEFLADQSVAIEALRNEVQSRVSSMPCAKKDEIGEADPTPEFQRAIQQAIESVRIEGRGEVTIVDVLASALHPAPRRTWWQRVFRVA